MSDDHYLDQLEDIAHRMAQEIQDFIDESADPQPGATELLEEFNQLCNRQ